MTDILDTIAHDTVTAARVPPDRAAAEVENLARAMRGIAEGSRANGLDDQEIEAEARAVASVTRATLALRYASEAVAP